MREFEVGMVENSSRYCVFVKGQPPESGCIADYPADTTGFRDASRTRDLLAVIEAFGTKRVQVALDALQEFDGR